MTTKKDIILVVGMTTRSVAENIVEFQKELPEKHKFFLVTDKVAVNSEEKDIHGRYDDVLVVNFDSDKSIQKALLPYHGRLLAVTCRAEAHIPKFKKIIPHVPYLKTPTPTSLTWSVDKLEMRRRFKAYDSKITPKYMYVKDAKKATLEKIEDKVGFPLIVKPTGLAVSLLVNIAYHPEELKKNLNKIFKKYKTLAKGYKGKEPRVLVEQFMEGTMYSIDSYVNSRGHVYHCPMVSVKTGKEAGFDDFFGYQQMTPVSLKKSSIENAHAVAEKAIHALGLRSTTAHIELMRTEHGWKVIEVGPRVGGFRHNMYELSYGINHTANDIFIRIPKKPKIQKKVLGYTAVFKVFPKEPGVITKLKGIKKIKELGSLFALHVNSKVGDRTASASDGGRSVFNATLFNEDRSKLLADIRRMEQMIEIETTSRKNGNRRTKKKNNGSKNVTKKKS